MLPLLPRKYSATALVYPKLFSSAQEKSVARASIDASSIVNGEARLIVSDAILQAVVKRLNLGSDAEAAESPSWMSRRLDWLRDMFFPEIHEHSRFDRGVAMLRNRVEVTKDTRSYLISISFTTRSAEEATRVVNAVALEYLRDKSTQSRRDAVTTAEAELVRQLAINGERHPKVLQAADELSAARAALTAAGDAEAGGQDTIVADEGLTLAIPNRTPTSPKGSVILGLALILGLLSGVGLAVWRDRLGLEPHRRLRDVLPVDLRFGQHFIGGLLARLPSLCRRAHEMIQIHVLQRWDKMHKRKGQETIASPEDSDWTDGAHAHAAYRGRRRVKRSKLENIVEHQPPAT
jgi:capsular polysaccharide biosynthesis protein